VNAEGRASGAVYYDRDGKLRQQTARVVVLSANGVGTARLLLLSKSNLFPQGLGNSSGLVGRNFMLHPFRFLEGQFEQRIDGHDGPFGIPAYSLRMPEHAAGTARLGLEAAGAVEILDSGVIQPAFHLLGTARMGTDPKRSVVNAWHQAHDLKNLFIVDGSSFTTSAAVNPTATIGALALRCADGIWARRREWA